MFIEHDNDEEDLDHDDFGEDDDLDLDNHVDLDDDDDELVQEECLSRRLLGGRTTNSLTSLLIRKYSPISH